MKSKIVLIGASTGGPGHLKKILSALPSSFHASVVIAQHMNSAFMPSFISQFNNELPFSVFSIDQMMTLKPSCIYFCSHNCALEKHNFTLGIAPHKTEKTPYNPSVDTLFHSALPFTHEADILAVLLTGIGNDGALGLSELQKKGATCIAENEQSAIVYGMPKRAMELNANITSLPLEGIILTIQAFGEA